MTALHHDGMRRACRPRARSAPSPLLAAAALAALALLCACAGSLPEAPVEVDSVVQHLSASDFGLPSGPHAAVAKIGDEARECVVGPRWATVASLHGVRLEGGHARRELSLPAAARGLPDEAFALDVQELPFASEAPEVVLDMYARNPFTKRVEGRWKLERDDPRGEAAVLEFSPETRKDDVQFNLELRALELQPSELASREFTLPAGARLELGYGVSPMRAGGTGTAVRFRAVLLCTGAEARTLVDATVSVPLGDAPRWHDAAVPVTASAPCRLQLVAAASDGSPVRTAVWAVPRIVAPLSREAAREAYNLVLISLDTLRADRLSGYGYARDTSPVIDARLIAEGTTFTDAMTTFPQTDVSHLSAFTSLYPAGQPERGRLAAGSPAVVLAERLGEAGFLTAAFTEDALVAGAFGFWFGFDRFVERTFEFSQRGIATFADGREFLRAHRDERFFLFLHTYKTHSPYVASEPYAKLFDDPTEWEDGTLDSRIPLARRGYSDAYDRTIREADDLVGSLLDELDRLGLARRTVVVLTSDHGEAFGEHGAIEHGFAGHQEQLRIPLVFRGPGIPKGVEVETPVSLVDLAPTLLDLAGAAPLPDAQGISLRPAFRGAALPAERPLFFSWITAGARGVRHGRWKFLSADHGHELFDLASDPLEKAPQLRHRPAREQDVALLDSHASASAALRDHLVARSTPDAGSAAISDRMEDSLRALGYLD
jgi:arylsulfatase A-like enzyme